MKPNDTQKGRMPMNRCENTEIISEFDFCDRPTFESMLGKSYRPRIYQSHGSVSRGICEVEICKTRFACTAYSIDGGNFAVGVAVNLKTGTPSLILTPGDRGEDQSKLAETIDFWENQNTNKVYCLHEKSCGAIVFTGDGENRRFLMIRMNLGHCGLPKGHVEKFETEEMAAIREIREETGVDAKLIPGFRQVVEYSISAKTRKTSVYFIGRFDGDEVRIQESEVQDYRLCGYEEARRFITHDNDRAIFDAAAAWLRENEI